MFRQVDHNDYGVVRRLRRRLAWRRFVNSVRKAIVFVLEGVKYSVWGA